MQCPVVITLISVALINKYFLLFNISSPQHIKNTVAKSVGKNKSNIVYYFN